MQCRSSSHEKSICCELNELSNFLKLTKEVFLRYKLTSKVRLFIHCTYFLNHYNFFSIFKKLLKWKIF